MTTASKLGLSLALLASTTVSSWAQVSFSFDYTNAPDFTPEAKASLESAASITSSFFNHTASIEVEVQSVNNGGGTLASAGSEFAGLFGGNFQNGFGNRGVVGHEMLTGTDANGATKDATVTVNFGQPWDYDDDIDGNKFDFKSTLIHELLHAVGFSSDIQQNGNDAFGTPPGNPGKWVPFDEFVADSNGALINNQFALDGTRWDAAKVGGTGTNPASDGLYFNGPNAVAAHGAPVPIYSPDPFEQGSSGSHLDDNFFNGIGAEKMIMNAATGTGPGIRSLSNVEIGIFKDLGFTVVPEPHEYAIMTALGLFAIVYVRRRRIAIAA